MAKAKLQRIPSTDERQANTSPLMTEDVIAQRAYALYLARGAEDGHDVEDWLRAERELQETSADKTSASPKADSNAGRQITPFGPSTLSGGL